MLREPEPDPKLKSGGGAKLIIFFVYFALHTELKGIGVRAGAEIFFPVSKPEMQQNDPPVKLNELN
jgi:hypothetical protein